MIDVEKFMQEFCRVGAESMRRYADISGEAPDHLPEYFMAASIFDRIGVTATLETRFSKLFKWNNDVYLRRKMPARSAEEEAELLRLAAPRQRRVDMVLFEDKDNLEFWGLVEFKKGEFGTDREKLLKILQYIDTCPYGMTCGSLRGDPGYLEFHTKEAIRTNDRCFHNPVPPSSSDSRSYFFFARLFERE